MATLRSDIVIPEIFTPYVEEQTTLRSAFLQSGVVQTLDALNATDGGDYVQVPSFDADLSGDAEVLTDSTSLTPDKIGADLQRAVILHRGRAWEVRELARLAAGADPMAAIGSKVAAYIAHQQQRDLISTLAGVFGPLSANTTGAFKDLSIDDKSGNTPSDLGPVQVAKARAALGDQGEKLVAMAMHSALYYSLYERKALDFVTAADSAGWPGSPSTDVSGGSLAGAFGSPTVPIFMGMRVIVSDDLTPTSTSYPVYFFAPGSIATGVQQGLQTETDRDILAQSDAMAVTWHNCYHPIGARWKTTGGTNPTRTALATAANYEKVFETKNIGIARAVVTSNY